MVSNFEKRYHTLLRNMLDIFMNHFVTHIPCWTIRRLFYLCLGMKIGIGSRISTGVIIMKPWRIRIGNHVMINEYVILDGRGGLRDWR